MGETKDMYESVYEGLVDDKKQELSQLQQKIEQHITMAPLDKIQNSITGSAKDGKSGGINELISAAYAKRMSKDIVMRYYGGTKNEKSTIFGKFGQFLGDKLLDNVLKQENSYDSILISQEVLVVQKFKVELDALKGSIVIPKAEPTNNNPAPAPNAPQEPDPEIHEGYAEKSHYTEEEKKQIDAVIGSAKQYQGVKYAYGGTSKNGIDCSGLRSKAFGEQYKDEGRTFGRLTAALFDTKAPDIDDEQVERGDRMFWEAPEGVKKKGGINENGEKIYHIEMALAKPVQKNGKWYVKTYGSSTDKTIEGKSGVGYRIREIKDNHHFAKPPYYEKLVAMKKENGTNTTA